MASTKIGIIDETGDLGLGFDELSDRDQKVYDANNNHKAMSMSKDKDKNAETQSRQK